MKKVIQSCVAIALVWGALLLTTSVTSAAVGHPSTTHGMVAPLAQPFLPVCNGDNNSCNGQLPFNVWAPGTNVTCQADQRVIASVPARGGAVKLMYSNRCRTNWSEFVTDKHSGRWIANANITRESDKRFYQSTSYDNIVVSPMVYAPKVRAKACGSTNGWTGSCTAFI